MVVVKKEDHEGLLFSVFRNSEVEVDVLFLILRVMLVCYCLHVQRIILSQYLEHLISRRELRGLEMVDKNLRTIQTQNIEHLCFFIELDVSVVSILFGLNGLDKR